MEKRVRKLGVEKKIDFSIDFDAIYDKYKKKAEDEGYDGDLKFRREHGKVIIFVILD